MRLEVITGPAAREAITSDEIVRRWDMLHRRCPWATAFQTHAFASAWYATYAAEWRPILVYETDGAGVWSGLLALAVSSDGDRLVVAGAHQAEYQVWIATPERGDSFIVAALDRVDRGVPGRDLTFAYLPPFTPIDWVTATADWRRRCSLSATRRPLVPTKESRPEASLRKTGNRSRLGRLRRDGPLRLERLQTPRDVGAALDTIAPYYDLRHGAVSGTRPFREDPRKRAFLLALAAVPGLLHASVLKAGDEIVAANFGVCDDRTVHLGVFAHSPFRARESPGKFLMRLLAPRLAEEGYTLLDLTPGGDAWKERMALAHETVHTLAVSARNRGRPGAWARRWARAWNWLTALPPHSTKTLIRGVARRGALIALVRGAWHDDEIRVYVARRDGIRSRPPGHRLMRRDAVEDLVWVPLGTDARHRGVFPLECWERLAAGQHAYTHVNAGGLAHWAWLAEGVQMVAVRDFGDVRFAGPTSLVALSPTSATVSGGGLLAASLREMLADAAAGAGDTVHVLAPAEVTVPRALLDELRLTYVGSLVRRARLGRVTRYSTAPTVALPA